MNIFDALDIVAPIEQRCIDCGTAILDPNQTLCHHCRNRRYADSDADQIPREWEDQMAEDDAGVNRWGPL